MIALRLAQQFCLCGLLMAAGLIAAEQARAEAEHGKVFEDWGINCIKNPQNPEDQFCTVVYVAINTETDKPFMKINVGYPPDAQVPRAVFAVPLVVDLPPGLTLQIDAGEAVVLPFEICNPGGCQVHVELKRALLSQMQQGAGGKIILQVPPQRKLTVPFSLKGFSEALATLR